MREPATPRPTIDEAVVATALSNEYSRRILAVCIKGAQPVREIEQATGLPSATVYRHVTSLIGDGLLYVERSAITPDGKRYELYRSRVRKARIELDTLGVRIFWEPVEAVEEKLARVWHSLRGI